MKENQTHVDYAGELLRGRIPDRLVLSLLEIGGYGAFQKGGRVRVYNPALRRAGYLTRSVVLVARNWGDVLANIRDGNLPPISRSDAACLEFLLQNSEAGRGENLFYIVDGVIELHIPHDGGDPPTVEEAGELARASLGPHFHCYDVVDDRDDVLIFLCKENPPTICREARNTVWICPSCGGEHRIMKGETPPASGDGCILKSCVGEESSEAFSPYLRGGLLSSTQQACAHIFRGRGFGALVPKRIRFRGGNLIITGHVAGWGCTVSIPPEGGGRITSDFEDMDISCKGWNEMLLMLDMLLYAWAIREGHVLEKTGEIGRRGAALHIVHDLLFKSLHLATMSEISRDYARSAAWTAEKTDRGRRQ